jgi:UDP-2,4-diacetamido-2,4,6-trideoxy-beta-L-altropyranose hydrolase
MEVVRFPGPAGTLEDSGQTARVAEHYQAKWVVVDGYQFGADYQEHLISSGLKVLFVDDNGQCDHYSADLVLNQNPYADEAMYGKRDLAVKLLLGLRYALLRREYKPLRGRHIPRVARNLLVTMGGSDALNYTKRVLQALPFVAIEGMIARVVIGGSSPHRASLEESASHIGGCVELLNDVGNMAEVITWADIGVAAAGTVSWEICVLGLPALLIPVADNQCAAAADLERRGAARILQPDCGIRQISESIRDLMLSSSAREMLSKSARSLLDTGGSERVVAAILSKTD